ncbi:uncharacterized protein [Lepeophtheirus salmonis]
MGCGSVFKYVVFLAHFVFFCLGIALISIGAYLGNRMESYFDFEGNSYFAGSFVIIGIGIVILIISFFGCCGMCMENACLMRTLGFLLFLLILTEIGVVVSYLFYKDTFQDVIVENMIGDMDKYNKPDFEQVTKEWNHLQIDFACCGTNDYKEWFNSSYARIPDSCCKTVSDQCAKDITIDSDPSAINTEGCIKEFNRIISDNQSSVIGVGVGLLLFELLGIIIACCYGNNFSDSYVTHVVMENRRSMQTRMRTRSKGPAESIADKVLTRKRRSSSSSYESPSRKKNNISSDKTTEYGAKSTLPTLIENSTVKTKSPQKSPSKLKSPQKYSSKLKSPQKSSLKIKSPQKSPIKAKSPQKSPFKEVNEDQNEAPLHLSDMDEDTTSKEVEVIYEFEHKNHSQVPNNVPKSPVKFDSLETIQVEKAFAQIVPKSRSEKMVIVDRVKVRPIVVEGTKKICRSGRFWKSNRDRFSSLVTTKGLKSNLKKKNALRNELKKVKALERSIKDENKMKKEELKQRRLDNAKRREINERKSEVVQTLKNPAKIKRMKKKQLRMLAKRDLTRTEGVVAVA